MISCWFMVNWKTYKNHKTSKCVCHKMLQSVSCRAKKGWNFIEECWQTHEFINLIQTSLNLISTARKRKQTDKKLLSFTILWRDCAKYRVGSLQEGRQLLLGSGTHSWLGAIHEPQSFFLLDFFQFKSCC